MYNHKNGKLYSMIYGMSKYVLLPGVMVHACNPSCSGRLRQEDHVFKASLSNLAKP